MEAARSVVFDRTSYPPLILAFCSSVHRYCPFTQIPMHMHSRSLVASTLDEYSWLLCSLFFPRFPLLLGCRNQTLEPRIQTPPSTTTRITLEVPTTTCRPLTTTRSSLGGSQAGCLRLFRSVSQFVLAILWQLV